MKRSFRIILPDREEVFVPSMEDDGTFIRHTFREDGIPEFPSGDWTEKEIMEMGGIKE
jgi:hypothetical protein